MWIHSSSPGNDTNTVTVSPQTVQTRKFRMISKKKNALTYKLWHSGRSHSSTRMLQSTPSLSFEHHAARNRLPSRISSYSWWQTNNAHFLFLVMTLDTSWLQNIHLIHTYASKKNYSQTMNNKCLTFKCDLCVKVANICINYGTLNSRLFCTIHPSIYEDCRLSQEKNHENYV